MKIDFIKRLAEALLILGLSILVATMSFLLIVHIFLNLLF
jgi:hypothetical protein